MYGICVDLLYLQDVEGCDGECVDAWHVAEGLGNAIVLAVNHQGPLSADIPPVSHLTLTLADVPAVLGLLHILICSNLHSRLPMRVLPLIPSMVSIKALGLASL